MKPKRSLEKYASFQEAIEKNWVTLQPFILAVEERCRLMEGEGSGCSRNCTS